MSGYIGDPDAEAKHAMIIAENGVHAARMQLVAGKVSHYCEDVDCGEVIPESRRQFFLERNQQCRYCVDCAPKHVTQVRFKMLDRIL